MTADHLDGATDPGWGRAVRRAWIPPQIAMRRKPGTGPFAEPPIIMIRSIFLTFVLYVVLFGVALGFVLPLRPQEALPTYTVVVPIITGGVALLVDRWMLQGFRLRVGLATEPPELVAAYQRVFFLGIAVSEIAALVGFVLSFQALSAMPFLAGALFTLLGLALNAPTTARLHAFDTQLPFDGSRHPLSNAVFTASSGRPNTL